MGAGDERAVVGTAVYACGGAGAGVDGGGEAEDYDDGGGKWDYAGGGGRRQANFVRESLVMGARRVYDYCCGCVEGEKYSSPVLGWEEAYRESIFCTKGLILV